MNIVIVKHENCRAKYLFLVPDGKTLNAGDLVRVNTKHGQTLATCLCDSFVVEDKTKAKYIANAFGVNEPTAYVIGRYEKYENWDETKTNDDAAKSLVPWSKADVIINSLKYVSESCSNLNYSFIEDRINEAIKFIREECL